MDGEGDAGKIITGELQLTHGGNMMNSKRKLNMSVITDKVEPGSISNTKGSFFNKTPRIVSNMEESAPALALGQQTSE